MVTLWFNIINHPPHVEGQEVCTASDTSDASKLTPPTPPLRFLNSFLWVTGFIGEEAHLHHHAYPRRAKRPGVDYPFRFFVGPLERAGLLWKLEMPSL